MKKNIILITTLAVLAAVVLFVYARPQSADVPPAASGQIIQGYRVLPVKNSADPVYLVVFRGDYIKFDVDPAIKDLRLKIQSLSIDQKLERDLSDAPFFKMKAAGRFPFSLGTATGAIEVIDFRQSSYAEVDSKKALAMIASDKPLVLDVRTPMEFKKGHLEGAVLIPLQELQKRLPELAAYKNKEILIYCATGNRSTVASKILIDNGFNKVTNMRYGIVNWVKEKLPLVR
jgi:rhodanese-related sulfurtransferase